MSRASPTTTTTTTAAAYAHGNPFQVCECNNYKEDFLLDQVVGAGVIPTPLLFLMATIINCIHVCVCVCVCVGGGGR